MRRLGKPFEVEVAVDHVKEHVTMNKFGEERRSWRNCGTCQCVVLIVISVKSWYIACDIHHAGTGKWKGGWKGHCSIPKKDSTMVLY